MRKKFVLSCICEVVAEKKSLIFKLKKMFELHYWSNYLKKANLQADYTQFSVKLNLVQHNFLEHYAL